jgi:hypothetical protein
MPARLRKVGDPVATMLSEVIDITVAVTRVDQTLRPRP